VAVQALHTQVHVNIMSELNGLFGGRLGRVDPKGRKTEQRNAPDQDGDQAGRLKEPSKKITDHAYSCDKISFSLIILYLCKKSGWRTIPARNPTRHEAD
jgi:hypothetical protein